MKTCLNTIVTLLLISGCQKSDLKRVESADDLIVGSIAEASGAFVQEHGRLPDRIQDLASYFPDIPLDGLTVEFELAPEDTDVDPLLRAVVVRVTRGASYGWKWYGGFYFGKPGRDWILVSPLLKEKYKEPYLACEVAFEVNSWKLKENPGMPNCRDVLIPDRLRIGTTLEELVISEERWFVVDRPEWKNRYAFPWSGPRKLDSMRVLAKAE